MVEHYQSNVWQICKALLFLLERDGKIMCQQELVNSLNQIYVSFNADISPLDGNILLAFFPAEAGVLSVQPHEVFKKLLAIKPSKAHDPDHVPCRIVKEFAYELAEPITTITSIWYCTSNLERI